MPEWRPLHPFFCYPRALGPMRLVTFAICAYSLALSSQKLASLDLDLLELHR